MTGTASYMASAANSLSAVFSAAPLTISASATGNLFVLPYNPLPGNGVGYVRIRYDSTFLTLTLNDITLTSVPSAG